MRVQGLVVGCARHPWLVVGGWIAAFIAGTALIATLGLPLTNDSDLLVETEADRGERLINERLQPRVSEATPQLRREFVFVESTGDANAGDAEFDEFVRTLTDELLAQPSIATATSYLEAGPTGFVSDDGRAAFVPIEIAPNFGRETAARQILEVAEELGADEQFDVLVVGDGSVDLLFNELAEQTLQRAELIGLPLAFLVLIVVFGAVVAAVVPLVLAAIAILMAVAATALLAQAYELSTFVINMITMIGLAVGIDYSLLALRRYREEIAAGEAHEDTIAGVAATAMPTVLFSGITVIVALAGLLIFPDTIFRSLGAGAILVVVMALCASLTLLPALIALLGRHLDRLRLPWVRSTSTESRQGFWGAVARAVMRRPIVSLALSAGLLLALALPYVDLQLGANGIGSLPEDSLQVRGARLLRSEFSEDNLVRVSIAVDVDPSTPTGGAAFDALLGSIRTDDGLAEPVITYNDDGTFARVTVPVLAEDASSSEARDAVERLAEYVTDAYGADVDRVLLTGGPVFDRDWVDVVDQYTPIIFGLVLGFSFLVLLTVFRSIVVPAKAILLNLLSVGAAYGLLVLVFQRGVAANLLGFQQVDVVEAWIPLFLFSILFGLSMDYHVFLLSRIREHFDETGDNTASVAFGLEHTGAVITGAALIMVVIFSGFAAGDLVMFQQMGFGLAIAVVLDATLIRAILVPASMRLLGDANWYLPAWLEWLPHVRAG